MKKELQDKLFKKYPKIFRQKDLLMKETAMCWGITTGDGWYWLIDTLCQSIQNHCKGRRISQVEATQVKEKFGGLRFYMIGLDSYIEGMADFAGEMSFKICEVCGTTKDVKQCKSKAGWIHTGCKKCMEFINV